MLLEVSLQRIGFGGFGIRKLEQSPVNLQGVTTLEETQLKDNIPHHEANLCPFEGPVYLLMKRASSSLAKSSELCFLQYVVVKVCIWVFS